MGNRLSAYLSLMRAPNAFTAMADVLAGSIIAAAYADPLSLLLLLASSFCIYSAGCALNDICDRKEDSAERPERPIPSGAVTVTEAFALTATLFAAGVLLAYMASPRAFTAALVLSAFVVLYDTALKKIPIAGPVNMGACRAMNLMLGMAAGAVYPHLFILPLITLAYGACATVIGRFETASADNRPSIIAGWASVVLVLTIISAFEILKPSAFLFIFFFALFTGPAVWNAFKNLSPEAGKRAVNALLLGFPILNAVYVSGAHGILHAVPVALLALPALLSGRFQSS